MGLRQRLDPYAVDRGTALIKSEYLSMLPEAAVATLLRKLWGSTHHQQQHPN